MNIGEYIDSGIIELYVAGVLSEEESKEVSAMMRQHENVRKEVELVERTLLVLTQSAAPTHSTSFSVVKSKITLEEEKEVIPLKQWSKAQRWGWAAILIITLGSLIWALGERNRLHQNLLSTTEERDSLELQISNVREDLSKSKELLEKLRAKEVVMIALNGQSSFKNSYAKAYWNKASGALYIDALGLPEPPEGKEYQLWSLTLNPLTPSSLGMLSDLASDEDKVFSIQNPYESEAFGITLEPLGGSESPTMEQLYTLGLVPNA